MEFSFDLDNTLYFEQLRIGAAEELDANVAERLRSKLNKIQSSTTENCTLSTFKLYLFQIDYTYVAPEHQF